MQPRTRQSFLSQESDRFFHRSRWKTTCHSVRCITYTLPFDENIPLICCCIFNHLDKDVLRNRTKISLNSFLKLVDFILMDQGSHLILESHVELYLFGQAKEGTFNMIRSRELLQILSRQFKEVLMLKVTWWFRQHCNHIWGIVWTFEQIRSS